MLNAGNIQYFQHGESTPQSDENGGAEVGIDHTLNDSIPARYQDGRGGIDLEQVRRDQREARRQVLQWVIRRLRRL
ncbi:hypothetical protein EAO82_04565 [Halopseudomonas pelagia]|uniref:Uncharacterized protein n=1 Tax=Halopseudomonas pelagia TaxID=553151 RepID=A0AA91Z4S2_9GAMM|nr:hypothetical protein CO192_17655 [Halopseudomonas pelagia]QFY55703.1 hypothetical protein EAO82_04565 [Halopseudomonas pelagia]